MNTAKALRPSRRRMGSARRRMAGIAAIEFAILMPLLLLLAIPIFDVCRNVQANMVLSNISREGANLALRASLTFPMQTIMTDLAATAPPLNMVDRGMMLITEVMGDPGSCSGSNCPLRNVVLAQYRWLPNGHSSNVAANSKIWNCGADYDPTSGACNGIKTGSEAPVANILTGQLLPGQIIYVVESFYTIDYLFGNFNFGAGGPSATMNPYLYSMNVF